MRARVAATLLLAVCTACRERPPAGGARERPLPFEPSRHDRAAFRARHPEHPGPDYLPFMLHRLHTDDARGDALIVCRWDATEQPLAISIEPPVISESLAGAVRPLPPEQYTRAVERAIDRFAELLAGAIRITRATPEQAALRVRLLGEIGPAPEANLAVLGTTALAGACTLDASRDAGAPDDGSASRAEDRLPVRYAVREVRVYVADAHGLLTPDQVERVALHELGHALGMRGHSPIPADAMYEMARDRDPHVDLSAQDARSFRALYALPNGTVYAWLPREASTTVRGIAAALAAPEPVLADVRTSLAREGLSLRLPAGWRAAELPHGLLAVDGETWDYTASLQLTVQSDEPWEGWLARHRGSVVGEGFLRSQSRARIAGRAALRVVVDEGGAGDRVTEVTAIELPGERVAVVIADAPASELEGWARVFAATLESLEAGAPPPPRPRARP